MLTNRKYQNDGKQAFCQRKKYQKKMPLMMPNKALTGSMSKKGHPVYPAPNEDSDYHFFLAPQNLNKMRTKPYETDDVY